MSTTITPVIKYAATARPDSLSPYTIQVLVDFLRSAHYPGCTITSTQRTPHDQARAMYQLLIGPSGVPHARKLYRLPGQQVVDVFADAHAAGMSMETTIALMAKRIAEVGPANVSRHCADPNLVNVLDVAPSSLQDGWEKLADVARRDSRVGKVLCPPNDPAVHLEIPQGRSK